MTSGTPPIDRRKFIKWLNRYCEKNLTLLKPLAESLSKKLALYGYQWIEMSADGISPQINAIEFDKHLSKTSYNFISILFDKYGKLQFSVVFGNRILLDEYRPTLMGEFARRQSELWSAKLWGARWYHFDKQNRFLKDWRRFEAMIPHIVEFLEHGTPHPNIYVGYRRESLP